MLPGRFGIGDLGNVAYRWADFVLESRQKLWQVLPLGPTGFADSPYASLSAFAGNPLLISLEKLVETGDLAPEDLVDAPDLPQYVDYGAVIAFKIPLLRQAARHFLAHASADRQAAFTHFAEHTAWLDDFAFFMALKDRFNQVAWCEWPTDIALRRPDAIAAWRRELAEQIEIVRTIQYLFFEQWRAVKAYASTRGIQIVGDIPVQLYER